MRIFRSLVAAAAAMIVFVPAAIAQWPTTCVELNDIVEAHLGNHENVGIYQRVFGTEAETACQNDHRDDVRSVFAWALGVVPPTPATPPPVPAVPSPPEFTSNWHSETDREEVTAHERRFAAVANASGERANLLVRCNVTTRDLDIYVYFPTEYLLDYDDDGLHVQWRWNDDAHHQSGRWSSSTDNDAVFVPDHQLEEIGYGLIHARKLAFRVTDDYPDEITSIFELKFSGPMNEHPVTHAFQACGRST